MRKSGQVSLRILSAIAETLRGPRELMESRCCVDEDGKIVPDSLCENSPPGRRFHWVYGGSSVDRIGDTVEGGSREPAVRNPDFGFRPGRGS